MRFRPLLLRRHFSARKLRSRAPLLAFILACTSPPPPTAETSLTDLGPRAFLDVTVNHGTLSVSLDPVQTQADEPGTQSDHPCPTVQAQATLNGHAMAVTTSGSGEEFAYDNSCGISGYSCTAPAFSGSFDATLGTIDLRVSDSTAAFTLSASMIRPTLAFADPSDGALHVGDRVNLTITPPPAQEEADGGLARGIRMRMPGRRRMPGRTQTQRRTQQRRRTRKRKRKRKRKRALTQQRTRTQPRTRARRRRSRSPAHCRVTIRPVRCR